MDGVKGFVLRTLAYVVRIGGKLATEEHKQARQEICKGCPYFGEVEPLPTVKTDGCKLCGCPVLTKPAIYEMRRAKDKVGKPITGSELVFNFIFNRNSTVVERVRCSDPDEDRWGIIDSYFQTFYKN